MQNEPARLGETELHGQPRAAKARITAEGGLGSVAVIVAHPDVPFSGRLEEDHSVRAHPSPSTRQSLNRLRRLELGNIASLRLENDEVIAGSGHLVKRL